VLCHGARILLAQAVEAEVAAFLGQRSYAGDWVTEVDQAAW